MKKSDSEFIPVNEPALTQRELELVSECVRSGWISSAGSYIEAFERKWADYCGRKRGIAVSSGTAALQMAVAALDLEPGDEVILPTFTIVSCALAVVYNRATPVLVDADPVTWTVDVGKIEELITPRAKAIMPVHIYGHPVDMEPIIDLGQKYSLAVIEDSAEAHGAEYLMKRESERKKWVRCGSMGDMSVFSFYGNKIITTGEGGMVLADDPGLAEKLASLRNLCFQETRRFYHSRLGFNFRLTNMQAALGVSQIERIDGIVARKRWIGQHYTENLKDTPHLQLPPECEWGKSTFWMYGVVIHEDSGMDAAEFATLLKARGVDTRPFFLGMHEQPIFRRMGLFSNESYPVAERIARQGLYLPSGLTLTEQQLERVCKVIKEILGH